MAAPLAGLASCAVALLSGCSRRAPAVQGWLAPLLQHQGVGLHEVAAPPARAPEARKRPRGCDGGGAPPHDGPEHLEECLWLCERVFQLCARPLVRRQPARPVRWRRGSACALPARVGTDAGPPRAKASAWYACMYRHRDALRPCDVGVVLGAQDEAAAPPQPLQAAGAAARGEAGPPRLIVHNLFALEAAHIAQARLRPGAVRRAARPPLCGHAARAPAGLSTGACPPVDARDSGDVRAPARVLPGLGTRRGCGAVRTKTQGFPESVRNPEPGRGAAQALGVPSLAASPCLVPYAAPAALRTRLARHFPALCAALDASPPGAAPPYPNPNPVMTLLSTRTCPTGAPCHRLPLGSDAGRALASGRPHAAPPRSAAHPRARHASQQSVHGLQQWTDAALDMRAGVHSPLPA